MQPRQVDSATTEWRNHYMAAIAACFGYSTCSLYFYGFSPYIQPISEAFGWTRVQTTAGMSIAMLVQACLVVPFGALVDRFGPRIFGLIGVLTVCASFAGLAMATGDQWNWYILWALLGVISLPSQSMVWTSFVIARFDRSRGLALAVTMCGSSLSTIVFPPLAAWLIAGYGWRLALVLQAAIWGAIVFTLVFFFLADRQRKRADRRQALHGQKSSIWAGFRSPSYLKLVAVGALSGLAMTSFVVNFVPILVARGSNPGEAAPVAALIGIAAIAGRIVSGLLLDRFRASLVGALSFLLPVVSGLLLLSSSTAAILPPVAALLLGFTLGAEIDVIAYLLTRHFSMSKYATLFGGLVMSVSIGSALGPLIASAAFDRYGNYAPFLMFSVVAMLMSSALLASLPKPPEVDHASASREGAA